jgi:hypothetical protein
MSTFYLLPPRPLLGEYFAGFLRAVFPGLSWDGVTYANLGEALGHAALCHPDVFVVYREELPEGETTAHALRDGYGAEPGDEIIEVRPGPRPGEVTARRWRVDREE